MINEYVTPNVRSDQHLHPHIPLVVALVLLGNRAHIVIAIPCSHRTPRVGRLVIRLYQVTLNGKVIITELEP